MGAEFIAEEGVLKGLILSLESGEEWTIGRDPDLCTIVIEDPKASRLHARVRKTEVGYSIENLSTTILYYSMVSPSKSLPSWQMMI